jgi:GT2 family glycosyltransferase
MTRPLVSVIVLSYNRAEEMRECLASVFAQDYGPMEVVVLDNGSTDDSVEMTRREFPSAKIVELDENVGACAGRNRALEDAAGEIIVQVDNDAVVEPVSAFSRMVERFNAEADLGIIFTRIEDPSTRRPYRQGYGKAHVDDEFYTWRFHGCVAAVRRKAVDEAGYYLPEEFFRAAEENDLAVRVLDAGYNILYMPETLAFHKLSPKTRDRSEIIYLTVRNNLTVAWKFYPMTRALTLSLWRVPHYLLTRTLAGDRRAWRRVWGIFKGIRGAISRRRPIKKTTMRIIDALAVAPRFDVDGMRQLREKPRRISLFAVWAKRFRDRA